jgi:hypothetical protein
VLRERIRETALKGWHDGLAEGRLLSVAEVEWVDRHRLSCACWTLAFILCAIVSSIVSQEPPAARGLDAPAPEFSSGRARQHVEAIAARPRPAGSRAIAEVRAYLERTIDAMGCARMTQIGNVTARNGAQIEVANVTARIKGSGNPDLKAVLLVAHYDSVPAAPGAGDDGSGTAALLETIRALKAGPLPKRDIVVLFTDAEEIGLFGAKMFVGGPQGGVGDGHPWMKDVGLVLNFESSGSHGPSVLFETSEQNGWLIREFARADPIAIGNSLAPTVYRLTGGSTDMNSLFAAGLPGLNFVFFEGKECYHTPADTPANLDDRSLQHQGMHALALARHFGNLEEDDPHASNAVYFNPVGRWFVVYPMSWAKPLAVGAILLYVSVLVVAWRTGRIGVLRLAIGFVLLPSAMALATLGAYGAWWLLDVAGMRAEGDAVREPVAGVLLLAAVLVFGGVYALLWRRVGVTNLDLGALGCWAILGVASGWLLPEASFATTWPLVFRLATTAVAWRIPWPPGAIVLADIGTIPAFTIGGAAAYAMLASLDVSGIATAIIIALCVPSSILPQICRFFRRKPVGA